MPAFWEYSRHLGKQVARAKRGTGFDLRKSVRGYCDHLRKLATGRGGENAIANAEAKGRKLRGELVEASAVEAECVERAANRARWILSAAHNQK